VSAQTNTSEETTEEVEEEDDSTEADTTDTETETGGDELESSDPTPEVISTTPPAPVQQPETTTTNNSGNASTVAPPAATAPASKSVTVPEPPPATTPLTTLSNTEDTQPDTAIALNAAMAAPTTQTYQPTAVVAETLPGSLTAPVTVRSIVADVLRWIGLPTLAVDLPIPEAPVPPLFEALWMAVRRLEYTFFNDQPTASPIYRQDPFTGVITGQLQAVDADGDHLTYTVTDAPDYGELVLRPDGTFTYTPGDLISATGGDDTFTVAVSDEVGNPFHLHGPLDALKVFGIDLTGPTTATVDLAVAKFDAPDNTVITTVDVGETPDSVVVSPDGTRAYVTNVEGTVSVIDTTTNTVLATIAVEPGAQDIVLNPDGTKAYVVTRYGVSEIDTATYAVDDVTFSTGASPTDLAVSPDGTYLAISYWREDSVALFNLATREESESYQLPEGSGPVALAFSADGSIVYVVNQGTDNVEVIVLGTTDRTIIAVGDGPREIALSPDGSRAYVANGNGRVTVINTETNSAMTALRGFAGPVSVAFSPDGARAYVTNLDGDTVTVINTTSFEQATFSVGDGPEGIAISPDGTRAYVVNSLDGTLSVISIVPTVTSIEVGADPAGVAVSPDGTRVYVADSDGDSVAVIDTASRTVITTVSVGDSPERVAVSADGTRQYVTNFDSDSVSVIDTATNTVIATVAVGLSPKHLAVGYVSSFATGAVSVINTDTNTVRTTYILHSGLRGVAYDHERQLLFVANSTDGTVVVIDTSSDTLVDGIPVSGGPSELTVAPDGRVYVSNSDGTVTRFDLQGSGASIDVGGNTGALAARPSGRFVYVVDNSSDSVAVIDNLYGSVLGKIKVGDAPSDVAFSPDGTRAYVTNSDGTLSIIRVEPISVPETPGALST
jgi:YVTN family beta-propeller protein/VCBS repeat-containing protein